MGTRCLLAHRAGSEVGGGGVRPTASIAQRRFKRDFSQRLSAQKLKLPLRRPPIRTCSPTAARSPQKEPLHYYITTNTALLRAAARREVKRSRPGAGPRPQTRRPRMARLRARRCTTTTCMRFRLRRRWADRMSPTTGRSCCHRRTPQPSQKQLRRSRTRGPRGLRRAWRKRNTCVGGGTRMHAQHGARQ